MDGRELHVPSDKTAADVLNENGVRMDVKCGDGLCGACKCGLRSGHVEHRDHVPLQVQQSDTIVLCQSRAVTPDDVLKLGI